MTPDKSIKVDDAVHGRIEALKSKYRVDTFNAVLRRELGLVPEPTADEIGAYLPASLKKFLESAFEIADGKAQSHSLETVVSEDPSVDWEHNDAYAVRYINPVDDEIVAEIAVAEDRVGLYYRNTKAKVSNAGSGERASDGKITYSIPGTDNENRGQVILDEFERKLEGAINAWV